MNEIVQVNKDAIKALEEMLVMAKSGRLVGIACATLYDNGHAGYAVAGEFNNETIGALAIIQATTIERVREAVEGNEGKAAGLN